MIRKLAWRNLWRHKRRTLITTLSVAFGLWMAVTFSAIGEHSYTTTIDTGARMGAGHVTIQPEHYLAEPSLDKTITSVAALGEEAMGLEHVVAATPRIKGQAMFAVGGRTRGGQFLAIDPSVETAASNYFLDRIVEGALFETSNERGIVVGRTMADRLKLRLGKKVVYTTTDKNGEIVSESGRVSGIFQTGVAEVDGGMVLLPLGRVRKVLSYGADESTSLDITLDNQRHAEDVAEALRPTVATLKATEVLGWQESMRDLVGYIALDRSMNQFFQFFIGLLVAAGILNTILMSVLERTREFGVMMAVGMSPYRLFALVVSESFFIGLVGLGMGAVFTIPWCIYLDQVGIDLTALYGGDAAMNGVVMDTVVRYNLPPAMMVGIVLTLFALTLASGIYPAWRATRVPPVEAIRLM